MARQVSEAERPCADMAEGNVDRPVSGRQPAPYGTPRLSALGDLRDLTLGGSVGRADSGAPTRQARVGGI